MKNVNRKSGKIFILLTFLLLGLGGTIWWWAGRSPNKPPQIKINDGNIATANPNVPSSDDQGSDGQNDIKGIDNKPTTPAANARLMQPLGQFVSNHRPNLSGQPAPNTISSVCQTTSGATCTITFTLGNTVKSLPKQSTDKGGYTYWEWRLQDIGLTTGIWQVEAVATLGSQQQTATDPMNLEVKP